MLRKKQRLDGKATNTNNAPTINHPSFQKPYTMSENLSGSVQAATKINNTLKSSLILLGSVTKEFNRQGYATQHERQYELATTLDIERVRQDLAKELKPEIDQSLDGVQLQLDALESQELDLQTDVDNQERLLRDIKAGNRTDTQQTRRLSRPTADELRDRKQKLMELIAEEDEQYTRVTEEVNKMKTTILKLERQMDAMEVDSSNEERAKEREKDLEHELAELEISANNKHEEVKKKQAENNKLPIVASQEAPIQITTEGKKLID
jgi:chromosome segregation ATPase